MISDKELDLQPDAHALELSFTATSFTGMEKNSTDMSGGFTAPTLGPFFGGLN